METLIETNKKLIATIDKVMQIQSEGRQKRRETEACLAELGGRMKNKLLQNDNRSLAMLHSYSSAKNRCSDRRD